MMTTWRSVRAALREAAQSPGAAGQPHRWWSSVVSAGSQSSGTGAAGPVMLWLVVVVWLPAAPAHVTGRRELQSCGSATFVAAPSYCSNYNSRNCYDDVPCGETCEGDWECGTNDNLNNCGNYDIYERSCSPTPLPTNGPTPRPTNRVIRSCASTCQGDNNCDFWVSHGSSCSSLEASGCDCSGCSCSRSCPATCSGYTCDFYVSLFGISCSDLEANRGCDCSGCDCLTPQPTPWRNQVDVEVQAAVVISGIAADDFNSDPAAQQAFTQSILAHLPQELVDNSAEVTDVVAVSIPGECDKAPTFCRDDCAHCMPTCSESWNSDCNAKCGSYAHCTWRRRRLQTGSVEDVWSRVEVSYTIVVQQDETAVTDGGASILAAVTSSLSSAVSTGAFLQTLIDEADAAGASATLEHVDVDVVASIISLDKATVTVINSLSCEVCTESLYKEGHNDDDVSCSVFEQKAAKRWGDWKIRYTSWLSGDFRGESCRKRCCASNKDDCCEANVQLITGLVVAISVVVAMCCCPVCAGCCEAAECPYPSCPEEHFCIPAGESKSVWRRCCPQHKGPRGSDVQPVPPGTVVGISQPTDDSAVVLTTLVEYIQNITGASAEAARAALVAHGNDADEAAAALLDGWHPPAAIAAQPAPAETIAEMLLRAENARLRPAAEAEATEERRQRLAAEARAAEAERKLRATEERAAEERRQRAAKEEAERQRRVRAATQNSRDTLPPYWNPIMDRSKARRFVVDPLSDSEEYARVEKAFMLTLDDPSRMYMNRTRFTIQSVERIQNMDLWNL